MDGWGNARVGRCSEKHWTGLDWGDWYGVVLMIGIQVLSFSTELTPSPTFSPTVCGHSFGVRHLRIFIWDEVWC
jgi:hypothetical protein